MTCAMLLDATFCQRKRIVQTKLFKIFHCQSHFLTAHFLLLCRENYSAERDKLYVLCPLPQLYMRGGLVYINNER
jgi:hypothetical protein